MDLNLMLKAIGDPTRFSILKLITKKSVCVNAISKNIEITPSAVSQHLKVLRESGLVDGEKKGYHTHYSPNKEAIDFLISNFQELKFDIENKEKTCHHKGGCCHEGK